MTDHKATPASALEPPAPAPPWWDLVILTARNERQAATYREQIAQRLAQGTIPAGCSYQVFCDPHTRVGNGGATLNALRMLAATLDQDVLLEAWWSGKRVLLLNCGDDPLGLPHSAISGKAFTPLPVASAPGEHSTIFDGILAQSAAWLAGLPAGLLVAAGDVFFTFDPAPLNWSRSGVTGVAMRQPAEAGRRHGVYVIGPEDRVYSFLSKPEPAEVEEAGGLLEDGRIALDLGLMRFAPDVCGKLAGFAWTSAEGREPLPFLDLYQHVTKTLTSQWKPAAHDHALLRRLDQALDSVPFWCCLVEGEFHHIGTTRGFLQAQKLRDRAAAAGSEEALIDLAARPAGLSEGTVVDSVLRAPCELNRESIIIECDLDVPLKTARGSIVCGLTAAPGKLEIPEDAVVHQIPVLLDGGGRGWAVRVYGVGDDPRALAGSPEASWLGQPLQEVIDAFGLDPELVWSDVAPGQRCLWNAALFPAGPVETAWKAAQWFLGRAASFSRSEWEKAERLSLESSSRLADSAMLAGARTQRLQSAWEITAVSLAVAGADIRPLLAHSPGPAPVAAAGRALAAEAEKLSAAAPTAAASLHFQAGLFLARAGQPQAAQESQARAFAQVRAAVARQAAENVVSEESLRFRHRQVVVSAPPRIDLGGGWSDTPPFCQDWGGTVLNIALELTAGYPIAARVERLEEPALRFSAGGRQETVRAGQDLDRLIAPGSPFAIHAAVAAMTGLPRLLEAGQGVEILTTVDLPMGSGLGTSSILSAAVLRALDALFGWNRSDFHLLDQVMRLEQRMTTGGGWQDQAGGIFPGAKLLLSGPGLRQKVRVQPVPWTAERQREFEERVVLYDTGIQRIAKGLLRQVVGRYLARETAAVQVLHSIKTLALEMSHALVEGEWEQLGYLLNRHWELNQVLDPNTTNAPIHALLQQVRPLIVGAKLAGAGGGGFMILLARDPEAARRLRRRLSKRDTALQGSVCPFAVANAGLRVAAG